MNSGDWWVIGGVFIFFAFIMWAESPWSPWWLGKESVSTNIASLRSWMREKFR